MCAFDAQYQYIGSMNLVSARTTWIHEKQDWEASFPLGNTANQTDFLNTFKINLSYFYKSQIGRFGGSLGYFSTTGRGDEICFTPQTRSMVVRQQEARIAMVFLLEADYILNYPLWGKSNTGMIKSSLQYSIYNRIQWRSFGLSAALAEMPPITTHCIFLSGLSF